MKHWMSTSNIFRRFWASFKSPSQVTLQATIPHHGIILSNLDPVPTSVNFSLQQFIVITESIYSTIDAPTFVNPMKEFFRDLQLEFLTKSFGKKFQLTTFFRKKDETLKMLYRKLFKLKEDTQSIIDMEAAHRYLHSLESTLTIHAQVLQ